MKTKRNKFKNKKKKFKLKSKMIEINSKFGGKMKCQKLKKIKNNLNNQHKFLQASQIEKNGNKLMN